MEINRGGMQPSSKGPSDWFYPPQRRRLVFARREALAPSYPDPHRDSEK